MFYVVSPSCAVPDDLLAVFGAGNGVQLLEATSEGNPVYIDVPLLLRVLPGQRPDLRKIIGQVSRSVLDRAVGAVDVPAEKDFKKGVEPSMMSMKSMWSAKWNTLPWVSVLSSSS